MAVKVMMVCLFQIINCSELLKKWFLSKLSITQIIKLPQTEYKRQLRISFIGYASALPSVSRLNPFPKPVLILLKQVG